VDSDELREFLEKTKLTVVRLQNLCEADERLAQVAVLYGVAFIAECMGTWADTVVDGTALSRAARELMRVLKPHLAHMFKRRDVAEQAEGA